MSCNRASYAIYINVCYFNKKLHGIASCGNFAQQKKTL